MSNREQKIGWEERARLVIQEWSDLIAVIYAITGASPEGDGRAPQDILKEWASHRNDALKELKDEVGDLEDEIDDLRRERDRLEEIPVFGAAKRHLIAGRLGDAIRDLAREHPDLQDLEYLYDRERGAHQ